MFLFNIDSFMDYINDEFFLSVDSVRIIKDTLYFAKENLNLSKKDFIGLIQAINNELTDEEINQFIED